MSIKNATISIRINSELKEKAIIYAESQSRTLASLIEYLLKKELENK